MNKKYWTAKKIALTAIMSASLEVFKLCLSFIANVELVSILVAIYAFVFGALIFVAVGVFILIEMAVWGIAPWVVSYVIYWEALALIFYILGKKDIQNFIIATVLIAFTTFCFGLLTSFVDISISGFNNFFYRFGIYYARGFYFYIIHIASNVVIFAVLYKPLLKLMKSIKLKYFIN